MNFMRVVLRATGLTATILSLASFAFGQTRIQIPQDTSKLPQPPTISSEAPTIPDAPPTVKIKKRNIFKRIFAPQDKLKAGPSTPVGIKVMMSDGTEQIFTLGTWLTFAPYASACSPSCAPGVGQVRGIFPTQYVDQIATMQTDGAWTYTRPGRNVQVWRNGLLQRRGPDYQLDQAGAKIIPVKYPGSGGVPVGWHVDDYVTVAYLF